MSLRVIFFGNSQSVFSNRFFPPLLEAHCELVGVVDVPSEKRQSTNPLNTDANPSFVELANKQGIPAFQPSNPNTPDFVETLTGLAPDLILAAGYMFLLKPALLSIPHIVAINLHASLLPAYRGKHPVFWALRNGERVAGLTAHVMDPNLDTGDIVYQTRVRTRKTDTVITLYDRIIDKSVSLIPRMITEIAHGKLPRIPQPTTGSSYFSSIRDEDFRLEWTRPAESMRRWIQTSPGECWQIVKGGRVNFIDAKVIPYTGTASPGELVRLGKFAVTLATGRDALFLRWVRYKGEEKLPFSQLCAELGLKAGDRL